MPVRKLSTIVKTLGRQLYAWLHLWRAVEERPVNYKSLLLSPSALEYVDLSNTLHVVAFDEITAVEFVRQEALFPCLDGPYLETMWLIQTSRSQRVEVMDEAPHRAMLLAAFARCLAGFDSEAASAGLKSSEAGCWLCFQPSHG